uniref:Basal body-orientation factor 1 n=1 Tax=Phasianus colchicus TaxID=9054 RepID=A0A669Q7C5_PHACC
MATRGRPPPARPPAAPRSPAARSAAGATSRRYRASRSAPPGAGVARRRPVSTAAGGNGSRGMEGGRAPPWEARLAEAEAGRAQYREAARLLARRNAELLCRQRRSEREAAAVLALLTEQGRERAAETEKLKKELIDLKERTQEENRKLEDYYTQQIKELEEKFRKKVGEISQIQVELNLIKEFRREKAAMEKELEDLKKNIKISNRRHQEEVVRLERKFLEEKVKADRQLKKLLLERRFLPLVILLNGIERQVFKENIHLHGASSYHLKEATELQKMKQKLEEDKILLLQEKEITESLIRKKMLQINKQKAQIGDLQHKVEKLEMALCHKTKESETKTQKTQHQALIENQASMVEIKKLQYLLEMKDQEMNRVKKLAWNILNERTEVERFFLDALEHVKREIIASRKHYKEMAQAVYYRKMMEACAGKEEFPKIKTFNSNVNSTNSVYRDLEEAEKCYWENTQFKKVDISELTWEQKERVLRLLFAKMNDTNLW